MKITHYLYNTFLVEEGDKKIAIDPGALFLLFFQIDHLDPEIGMARHHSHIRHTRGPRPLLARRPGRESLWRAIHLQ